MSDAFFDSSKYKKEITGVLLFSWKKRILRDQNIDLANVLSVKMHESSFYWQISVL